MDAGARIGYFCAGMLFSNSMPHFAIGLTGRRNITPRHHDFAAGLNLLRAILNFGSGYLVLQRTDQLVGSVEADSHDWLLALLSGSLLWSLFMVIVEASGFTHRQH